MADLDEAANISGGAENLEEDVDDETQDFRFLASLSQSVLSFESPDDTAHSWLNQILYKSSYAPTSR